MIGELRRFIVQRRTPQPAADPRLLAFARGLALGALVGAAVAGSRIWRRRRKSSVDSQADVLARKA